MGQTVRFLLFCLPWVLLFRPTASKPSSSEQNYDVTSPKNNTDEASASKSKRGTSRLKAYAAFPLYNRTTSSPRTSFPKDSGLLIGTNTLSNTVLMKISRRAFVKQQNQKINKISQQQRTSKNSSLDFLHWITAYNFLRRYNYMSHHKKGNHDMKSAIESYQRFMHLPVTGQLDNRTQAEMKRKRCGVPDVEISDPSPGRRRKRFAISNNKWKTKSLLYAIEVYTADMSVQAQNTIIAKAFKMWSDASGTLSFAATTDLAKAHIKIMFGIKKHGTCNTLFDGRGSILAHAFYPTDGRLHFDDDENFTDGVYSGTNLLSVAVHEIGHTLGLAHSDDTKSVMFPSSRGYVKNLSLGKEDINGVRYLYAGGTVSPGTGVSVCQDISPSCASNAGYCTQYPNYMNASCPKTCKFCV